MIIVDICIFFKSQVNNCKSLCFAELIVEYNIGLKIFCNSVCGRLYFYCDFFLNPNLLLEIVSMIR